MVAAQGRPAWIQSAVGQRCFASRESLRNIRPVAPIRGVRRMTGLSLREQLLQAGLVSEKQAKQAEQSQKRERFQDQKKVGRKQRDQRDAARLEEQQRAAAAKAAKDAELSRKREEKAAAKARWAEIRQLVEQHRIAKPESDDYYNFV